jgi:hypothetical protein
VYNTATSPASARTGRGTSKRASSSGMHEMEEAAVGAARAYTRPVLSLTQDRFGYGILLSVCEELEPIDFGTRY